MKMETFLFIGYFFMCLGAACFAKDCADYTSCGPCSGAEQIVGWFFSVDCEWCPLDKRCHAWGSQYTPCLGHMNVKQPANCPATTYGTYNASKAYEYTLLSAAAYIGDPQQCLNTINPSAGYVVKNVIAVQCDDYVFEYHECVAYIAVSTSSQVIAVSFRGTNSYQQLHDEVLTIMGTPQVTSKIGGKVEGYFNNVHEEMYPCINSVVADLVSNYPGYKVVLTGHSLGGAVASLTAGALVYDNIVSADLLELYTFGMPRVGNKDYAYSHDRLLKSSWNVVHSRDIFPHLPFCNFLGCNIPYDMSFHHTSEVYYPQTNDMYSTSGYTICHENEDMACSNGAVTSNPCDFDISTCIDYHRYYFQVSVGKHCEAQLSGQTVTQVWSSIQLSSSTCTNIPQ